MVNLCCHDSEFNEVYAELGKVILPIKKPATMQAFLQPKAIISFVEQISWLLQSSF